MKKLMTLLLSLCVIAGNFAMQPEDAQDVTESPKPRLRPRAGNGWKAPAPRLRAQPVETNMAKENNCGYIIVKVALHAPFSDGIVRIQELTNIKGEIVDRHDQYLALFTFNVPITNKLVQKMPKNIRPRVEASKLTREDKSLLAEQIRIKTESIFECAREGQSLSLLVEQVTFENGIATAYFSPAPEVQSFGSTTTKFERTMANIYQNLREDYRWGEDKSDGVWFDQEDPVKLRPSMIIISQKQSLGSKLQRAVNGLAAGRGRLSSKQTSHGESLSSSSNDIKRPTLMASHRTSASSIDTTPSRSPEKSPRNSNEEIGAQSFTSKDGLDHIRSLDITGNTLRVMTEIIETQTGRC